MPCQLLDITKVPNLQIKQMIFMKVNNLLTIYKQLRQGA